MFYVMTQLQPTQHSNLKTAKIKDTRLSYGLPFNLYSSSRKRKEKIGFKRQNGELNFLRARRSYRNFSNMCYSPDVSRTEQWRIR